MRLIIFSLVLLIINSVSTAQVPDTVFVQGDTVVLKRDTAIRNKLILFEFQNYLGKTVKEFLQNDTIKSYRKYFWSDEPPMKLDCLYLVYARGLYIKVYVESLKFQPRFSIERIWDFDKYMREKVSDIELDRDFFEENVVKKYTHAN